MAARLRRYPENLSSSLSLADTGYVFFLFLREPRSTGSDSFDGVVVREDTSEDSSSVPDVDLMDGRSGMRNECRRGIFSANLEDENLDSGGTWGIWSVLARGELSGGAGTRSGRFRLMWRGIRP